MCDSKKKKNCGMKQELFYVYACLSISYYTEEVKKVRNYSFKLYAHSSYT